MSDTTGGWSRTPEARRRYDLIGGSFLVAIAVILLIWSFLTQHPVPLTVQGSIVVFGAVGLAGAIGMLPIRNPQDFFGGMSLIVLSLTAFVASNDLPGMRGFAFGPGTAPRLFAFALALLSVFVVLTSVLTKGPDVTPYRFRGFIFIIGSILAFAATIRPLGLVTASFACMVICAAATDDVKWRETVIVAVVVTTFCAFLFTYGLNLPFQLWPRFW